MKISATNQRVHKALNLNNSEISLEYLKKPTNHTKEFLLKKEIFILAKKKYKGFKYLDFKKWYAANFFYSMQKMVNWNLKKSYNKIKPL